MHVTIDPSLDADADLRARVAARSPLLEGMFDGTAAAEWRKGTSWDGKPAVQLRLSDNTGAQAGADLLPAELTSTTDLETRFRDLRDALQVVRDWRAAVEELFVTTRPWCEGLPGVSRVEPRDVVVTEQPSGPYTVPTLGVVRDQRALLVVPAAAWVVGWEGMIRMHGPFGRAMLYYSRAKDARFHIPDRLPYRELPLTEVVFRELVEACLDA